MEKNLVIRVELVTSEELWKMAEAVRKKVFVKEQGIPENKEFDGNDFCAAHVVSYAEVGKRKMPIGTMRIRFFSDFVKFERMAILESFRKTGASERIMEYGIKYASEKGYKSVYGMCKKELLPRWEDCGYRPIEGLPKVEQNGMELIPIQLVIPDNPRAIRIGTRPQLLTALEGHWDEVRDTEGEEEKDLSKITAMILKFKNFTRKKRD